MAADWGGMHEEGVNEHVTQSTRARSADRLVLLLGVFLAQCDCECARGLCERSPHTHTLKLRMKNTQMGGNYIKENVFINCMCISETGLGRYPFESVSTSE